MEWKGYADFDDIKNPREPSKANARERSEMVVGGAKLQ